MWALALILAVAGGQAVAEVPPQECSDAGFGGYNVAWHDKGFVLYEGGRYDTALSKLVLDDCPGGRRLLMQTGPSDDHETARETAEAVYLAVEKALQSNQRYTMAQIGTIARKAGAAVSQGKATYESCACKLYGAVTP